MIIPAYHLLIWRKIKNQLAGFKMMGVLFLQWDFLKNHVEFFKFNFTNKNIIEHAKNKFKEFSKSYLVDSESLFKINNQICYHFTWAQLRSTTNISFCRYWLGQYTKEIWGSKIENYHNYWWNNISYSFSLIKLIK